VLRRHSIVLTIAAVMLLAACGDDGNADSPTTTAGAPTTTAAAPASTTSTTVVAMQPAIWPAEDVVFATPEEAAADFVATGLEVPPTLGEFRAGDARSGEIDVLFLGESGASTPILRSVLALRQLGPDDGWFVIAANSENATITAPQALAEVAAGLVTVEGEARGFEGTVLISAFPAGDRFEQFDLVVGAGGSQGSPAPYSVQVDLGAATPGTVVTVLVRGGTGLATDTGDFSAIPVTVG
jgi:hypothetical protein